ncbi:MAG: GNAT family N-acetyltransferase [Gammaproteobacteria bacterium]|nr:GNAT family N-acetyltransferase [Gammaproteobacteria bacterium]
MSKSNYVTRVHDSVLDIDAPAWNELLAAQAHPTPFMRHEFLAALERSGSAVATRGWQPRFATLWTQGGTLQAACPLYLKTHSRGEYVFDWSWADAHHRHGIAYYPKAVVAVPFTPVPGSRLLAVDAPARMALVQALLALCRDEEASSLHLLFGDAADMAACKDAGLMQRHTVQFHWQNRTPAPYSDFDDFLAALSQDKRKKIRQERRKVREAGVTLRHARGAEIPSADWDFFYRCYERTYLEHGNPPYLSRAFFEDMARTQAENWLLFVAERQGRPIASSLIAISSEGKDKASWGRYWGALERVDCLHFEACYYSPLQWCIKQGYNRFEGGAQGEHKLARALLPVRADSAHWLAHPGFAQAVEDFLGREGRGVAGYLDELEQHTPFKHGN